MDFQDEIKSVEKELLDIIVERVKGRRMAFEDAQKLAKEFLSVLPFSDQKDLLIKLKQLGEKYEEANTVYAHELGKVSQTARDEALTQMRTHIQQGNIEQAIATAKSLQQ
ncbi:MAG: hypothetical protein HY429_00655 [Candidatus Levybacteria bacterium]|nr:hypothetical protein [Candidatus Levybacteria bacterium]